MAGVTVKGFVIARILDLAKGKVDEEEFKRLEEDVGITLRNLRLNSFKDYPVEFQNEIEEKLAQDIWGRNDDQAFYQYGRYNFETFAKSAIGRTMLALIGKDPMKMLKASIRLMSTVMSGMAIEINDLSDRETSFRFRNNPYRPLGWKGILDAALESAGVEPRIKIVSHGDSDTEYLVSWV